MELSKEEIKERSVIAATIRFYQDEEKNIKKYIILSWCSILLALMLGAYIYIDAGACFKNYKEGLFLSLVAGLALMWGMIMAAIMRSNKYTTSYIDLDAMRERVEQLGGLESVPRKQNTFMKHLVLWLVITAVALTIYNNLRL